MTNKVGVINEEEAVGTTPVHVVTKRTSLILPNSLGYELWEGVVALTCLLSTILVTFQLSFRAKVLEFTVFSYIFDIVYIVHMAIRFYVPYIQEGRLVIDQIKIQRRYASREFIIDTLSVFPFELISLAVSGSTDNWEYMVRIERINRVLRFYTVMTFLGKQEDRLGFNSKLIRSLKYSLLAFTLMHFMSCGWYMLACPNESHSKQGLQCYAHNWAVVSNQNMETRSPLQRYMKCFYWATITATSTGYGDISAGTSSEKWFSIISMLCGIGFFFGPILGYMASTITNSDAKRARYTHRIDVIKDHLVNKSVSQDTQKKVNGYYEHLWHRHQGTVKDGMFHELPLTFQSEISLVLNRHVLENAPLFKDVSVEFMRMISLVIKSAMYLPKQVIVTQDEIRHTMFYIIKGTVEVLSDTLSSSPVKILNKGSFFGEIALLLNIPRSATVRASSYCEILILDRSDLKNVVNHFPEAGEQLYTTLSRRCEEAREHVKLRNKSDGSIRYTKLFTSERPSISYEDYASDARNNSISVVRHKYIINPKSKILIMWNIILAIVVISFSFVHTFMAAYKTSFGQTGYGAWFGIMYLVDTIYYCDMIIHTRTSVKSDNETLNDDPKLIFRQYTKSGKFWLDLISVLPIELPFLAISDVNVRWLSITFVRSNRMIKFYRVLGLLKNLESNIRLNIAHVRVIKLALLICIMCHLCACSWFFQACFGDTCATNSWAVHAQYNDTTPLSEIYITTLYWAAATMTSTGYGDIHAHTTREELIATFVFLIGLLLFGYCLSNIAATLTNKLYPKVQFMGRINAVVSFIKEQKLSGILVGRVEQYLGLVWRTHKGEAIPGSQLLMRDMPGRLQLEVSYEEMQNIISKVPIFRNADEYFIKLIASKLITYVFMPGDMVVYRGDVGREMYIIRRGLVQVLSQDQSAIVATLGPGGFFGEVGLIFGESRTADVRTKTYCEVAMLQKSDLDEVLKIFPLIEHQFKFTSRNTIILERIKLAAENAEKDIKTKRNIKRIDLIEQTKQRRSKSVFQWKNTLTDLKEEELEIDIQLNAESKRPYEDLHPVLYYLSHLLLRKAIHPSGVFFHTWTIISVIISCLYYIAFGLQFAFFDNDINLRIVNYVIEFFFLVDMYIKFHVGFYNEDGILITHPTATCYHYFKTNFLIDFLASAPFDIIAISYSKEMYLYMKLNRVLHILRVSQYFSYLEEPISSTAMLYQGIKFSIYTYLIIHVFACTWFKIGCPGMHHANGDGLSGINNNTNIYCWSDSWALQDGRDLNRKTPFHQYVTSMYWAAATACSVGYGDIHAYRVREKALSLFCMISGVVFFGYIIASVTASLANADAQRARYKAKLDTVNRFLTEQNVEGTLTKRVKEFYQFLWNRNKGVNLETLFEGLPNSLQADITLSLYKDIIESVPLFQGTELGFTKMLSLYIKPLLLPKGEYIVRKGDIGEEMYFIHKGIVEVVSEHATPIVFDTMSSGRFFGEISTIFSCPRTASLRTQTNADLFVLKKKDLDVVLGHYPHIRKQIMETAEERQKMVEERAKVTAAKKAEEDRQKAMKLIAAMRRFSIAAAERQSITVLNETGTMVPTNLLEVRADDRDDDCDSVQINHHCCKSFKNMLNSMKLQIIKRMSFTIRINSRLHWWKKLNCLLILLNFLTITYMASFQDHVTGFFVFNIVLEVSCYIEMFLKSQMVYLNISGDEVTDSREIAKHYLTGEFKFDIIANFPLWIFSFAVKEWQPYYSYLSLLQILRLKKLDDYFKTCLGMLDVNILLVRLSENVAQIIIQLQISACIWYIIACRGGMCTEDSWVTIRQLKEKTGLNPYQRYTDSVYWALATMTSTGYGDIIATMTNKCEMIFAAIVMVLGKILFGFVLGNVASTMANMESLRVTFEERFYAVHAHMKEQNVPMALRRRVINFFQYIWRRNKGSTNDGIFDHLPSCLHAELYLDLTGELMKGVPIFKGCELPFIRSLCTKASLVQFHESECIYRKGDIGNEMYFIKNGEVEITTDDGIEIFGKSYFFGDESLVRHAPRINTAFALTHVDLFYLRGTDLSDIFNSYPEEAVRIRENLGDSERRDS